MVIAEIERIMRFGTYFELELIDFFRLAHGIGCDLHEASSSLFSSPQERIAASLSTGLIEKRI